MSLEAVFTARRVPVGVLCGKTLAAFGTATCKDRAAILCCHAGTETVTAGTNKV
jgi:hypothetical protein